MGGSSKSQVVGYKYYLGMHMALCHGPVDKVVRIRVDKRCTWVGDNAGGRISISAPSLFGGESREGGIAGDVDIEMGGPAQGQNDYLLSQLGSNMPGFRGVLSAVLRQIYLGINPYLKPWEFRVQRIHTRQDGLAQWYDDTAEIPSSALLGSQAICFCMDYSASQDYEVSPGVTRIDIQKQATVNVLNSIKESLGESPVHIGFFPFSWKVFDGLGAEGIPATSYVRTYTNVTAAQIDELIDVVNTTPLAFGTAYDGPLIAAQGFFNTVGGQGCVKKTLIFVTDGDNWQVSTDPATTNYEYPEGSGIYVTQGARRDAQDATDYAVVEATKLWDAGVGIYAFNTSAGAQYTEQLSNTQPNGISILDGSNSDAVTIAIQGAVSVGLSNMNPAHIVRECLTDPDWGMGYPETDIDDAAFTAAADTLYDEQMGISILWDRATPLEDFILEILRHIDAVLYVDRATGQFVLKLIRGGYDPASLPLLDENNVEKVSRFKRPTLGELVNSMTVTYWDAVTGEDASITSTDLALQQLQGATIAETVQYPGFTTATTAAKALARDLRARSTPLASCSITANRDAATLNIGDPFRLTWADHGVTELVMRVTKIDYGTPDDPRVKIEAIEDAYDLPDPQIARQATLWGDTASLPAPSDPRIVVEAPYWELIQRLGQRDADQELTDDPARGYLVAAGGRPTSDTINATLYTDAGAGYEERLPPLPPAPFATLAADVGHTDTTWTLADATDLDLVKIGTHVQIDDELCRVDAVSDTSITVGRGTLDTLPAPHTAGARLIFWDEFGGTDGEAYADGETVNAKLLPVTGAGQLDIASAPADSVTMASRAIRPYPPGNVKLNGEYYPAAITGDLTVTWAHRDRTQQTATLGDFTDADIGPETGTTYTINIYDENNALLHTEAGIAGTSFAYTTEVADFNTLVYPPSGIYSQSIEPPPVVPKTGLVAEYLFDVAAPTLIDETGNNPGTISGPIYRPMHRFPYALQFDGASSVDIGTALAYETISISIWARNTTAGERMIDSRGTGSAGAYQGIQLKCYNTGTGDYLIIDDGAGQSIGLLADTNPLSGTPNDGDWHHLVVTYDGATKEAKLYLDGVLEYTQSNPSMGSIANTSLPHYLGFPSNGSGTQNYTGRLSRCRIYNTVLSQTDVDQLYAERQPGPRLIQSIPTSSLSGWTTWLSGDVEVSSLQDYNGDGLSLRKISNDDPHGAYYDLTDFDLDDESFELEAWTYRPTGYTGGSADRIAVLRSDGEAIGFAFDNAAFKLSVDEHLDAASSSGTTNSYGDNILGSGYLDKWRRFVVRFDSPDTVGAAEISIVIEMYDAAGNRLGTATHTKSDWNNGSKLTGVLVIGGHEYFVDEMKVTHHGPAYDSHATYRYSDTLNVRLSAQRDGYSSFQEYNVTTYREGYGYRYGAAYGGN